MTTDRRCTQTSIAPTRRTTTMSVRGGRERLARSLAGVRLPSIRLVSTKGRTADLSKSIQWQVVYCYPGAGYDDAESRAEDAQQRRAYRACRETLLHRHVRVAALSSDSDQTQLRECGAHEIRHSVLSDPQLRVADALGLPTLGSPEGRCYSRLTILAMQSVIRHVFSPVWNPAHNPSQVLAWLDIHA